MTNPDEFSPEPGVPLQLRSDLSLVLAPNPSPMTHLGTNTYLLGAKSLAVIDPGPDDARHLDALQRAAAGRSVTHIFLTHSHLDHSPLARPLANLTGAQVYAFGDSAAGRSAAMATLAQQGLTGGGEGIDHAFFPDVKLTDGQSVAGDGWSLQALHTPGHIGNHLCYRFDDIIFTGDHVMGWASSLVSPPDGDLTDFMRSCAKLKEHEVARYYPGHGAPIDQPMERLAWLIAHRKSREHQIVETLADKAQTIGEITRHIYADVTPALLPAAERNVFAHLVDLAGRGIATAHPALSVTAKFKLAAT